LRDVEANEELKMEIENAAIPSIIHSPLSIIHCHLLSFSILNYPFQ